MVGLKAMVESIVEVSFWIPGMGTRRRAEMMVMMEERDRVRPMKED